jgi:hypothetical protein
MIVFNLFQRSYVVYVGIGISFLFSNITSSAINGMTLSSALQRKFRCTIHR